jgi:hypothetical protein
MRHYLGGLYNTILVSNNSEWPFGLSLLFLRIISLLSCGTYLFGQREYKLCQRLQSFPFRSGLASSLHLYFVTIILATSAFNRLHAQRVHPVYL